MLEVRWHSRAGQGAKTGGSVLSKVMADSGKYVQDYAVYGAEKRGAPMNVFNRINDEKIVNNAKSMNPDYVLVIDPSLVFGDITFSTKENTKYILTTNLSKEELLQRNPLLQDKNLYLVDCIGISQQELGRPIPNTPMLGAFVKISKILDIEDFKKTVKTSLTKFTDEIINANMKAIQRAYDEVN